MRLGFSRRISLTAPLAYSTHHNIPAALGLSARTTLPPIFWAELRPCRVRSCPSWAARCCCRRQGRSEAPARPWRCCESAAVESPLPSSKIEELSPAVNEADSSPRLHQKPDVVQAEGSVDAGVSPAGPPPSTFRPSSTPRAAAGR